MFGRSPSFTFNLTTGFSADRPQHFNSPPVRSITPGDQHRSRPSMANSTLTPGPTTTPPEKGGSNHPDYIAFVLVPVFFLLGLLGVVICHVLKRKGYRCTTEAQDGEEEECVEEEEKDLELGGDFNDTISDNNDTVGQIVRYIMKNEANSDALKAMINENSIDSDGPPLTPTSPGTPTPPMTPLSPGAPPWAAKHTCNHLHTIGGPAGQKNICTRCSQKKWPLMRRSSARKVEHRRSHHGEVTVLAVGRFRVTKIDKPARERRTLLISDSNGSVPTSPVEAEPKSRTTSESQQEQTDDADKEKR
ncbi:RELT-like protein 1 isoform X2 [Notolabrus celidotus]|uniref:RELT-like protein 1 isoform X2 n=1 Tax=Notolabrus celidotus TaxID=1203425 RepID=UPI00148FB4B3|nr:RELT-like protein 1 isoform X2 [Notolabrus celidotus]XP_034532937.1 RELT-like protein 1 isoform X2 [Notolabrus celidotus]